MVSKEFEFRQNLAEIKNTQNEEDLKHALFVIDTRKDIVDSDDDNDYDSDGNVVPLLSIDNLVIDEYFKEHYSYPCMFLGYAESALDRTGPITVFLLQVVSKSEFES